MKQLIHLSFVAGLALMLAGCRTVDTKATGYQSVTSQGQPVVASPGSVTTQQPVQVKGVGARPDAVDLRPAQTQTATASAVLEQMRVLVRASAAGADAEKVATLLGSGVQGALAAAGYRVVYDGKAEIVADLGVTCEALNARGTRVVYKGDADVSVTRTPELNVITGQQMKDMVARNRFDVSGAPGRGAGDALKSVADKMSAVVSPWLADACLKVGGKLEICIVTIANAWFLSPHSDYPTLFVQRVRAMDGVYDCTILATDNVNKTLQARVVYDKDRYPDGIVNRLYTIKELNIHR
ncbi:MAG: hypothetical protein PHU80_05705 [Kiritimatiellae bacterium]|nr:hypothetical protein [Kiritimatiellia bacterium]